MSLRWFHKILVYLTLLSSTVNYAQTSIDSLRNILKIQSQDSNKVNTLNEISIQLLKAGDSSGSLQTANEALILAKEIGYQKGLGHAYFNLGKNQEDSAQVYANLNAALDIFMKLKDLKYAGYVCRLLGVTAINRNDFNKSLTFFKNSLHNFKAINDKKEIGYSYYFVALAYSSMNNPRDALVNYNNSLKYAEEEKDTKGVLRCLFEIGNLHLYQQNIDEALKYFNQRLSISKKAGDNLAIAQSYTSIIWVYLRQKKYQEAYALDSLAYVIYKRLGNDFGLATHFSNISSIKEAEGLHALVNDYKELFHIKIEESLKNRLEAIKLFEKEKDFGAVSDNYAIAAKLCVSLKKNLEAEAYAKKSLEYSNDLLRYDNLRNSYEAIVSVDSAKGDFKNAFQNHKLFIAYRDSNSNKEITQKLLQYEFDKKEAATKSLRDKKDAEAKRLSTQQYFIIAALCIVVLSVVIIALIQFRNNKNKQKANALLLQEKGKVEKTLIELKSAQAQLIQSEKMASLGELTAGIAHEIQNPLNFVNNFSEVNKELLTEMRNEIAKGNYEEVNALAKDLEDNQEKINQHGKRADAIVKGMLQHSRSSSGVKEPTDINKLADEYLRLAYHGLRAKEKSFNATLKTEYDEGIGNININPQEIGRVILNLINNAFYAVGEKKNQQPIGYEPIVSLTTKKVSGKVEIAIKDNGNGIPQKILDKIFQPFFTTKPTGQGTGLGLSLAYDIVKANGGELNVETKEGDGSVFTIQISVN